MNQFEQILMKLPETLQFQLAQVPKSIIQHTEEIRMRNGQKLRLQTSEGEMCLNHLISKDELQNTLNRLLNYSYYAYEDDLAKGFLTIEGGHRVGICGRAVIKNGTTMLIKDISSLNIRFAKEIVGCSETLYQKILNGEGIPENTLIISPPNCGKTTLLRDLCRKMSYMGFKVVICDERSEIAGMYHAKSSFDVGPRTDVLDGCDKAEGIPMLIRSMSPQIIVTDEIGKKADIKAMEACMNAGVVLIASIHGENEEDLKHSSINSLVQNHFFHHKVFLTNKPKPGTIREVIHV